MRNDLRPVHGIAPLLALLAAACVESRECAERLCADAGPDPADADAGPLGFAPSNVPPGLLEGPLADLVFAGEPCAIAARIDTDDCRVDCLDGARCEIAAQADGPEVAVLLAASLTIAEGIDVEVVGERPLVILAAGAVEIRGAIAAIDPFYRFHGCGGGHGCEFNTVPTAGHGPGGGGASYGSGGAGGGGHCGAGGAGGNGAAGSLDPGAGGDPYGEAAIAPLDGGSAGGKRDLGAGGAGGGALQISSAAAIRIAGTGVVNMSGNGGKGHAGGGGGAGGAILLEAPWVEIAGVLAANGGGGGAGGVAGDGMAGQPGAAPALGGATADGAPGGDGAWGGALDGARGGAYDGGLSGGGGGGGAGWIRINAADGGAEITGVVSPALGSGCASTGALAGL
jgi:hypothetical protein